MGVYTAFVAYSNCTDFNIIVVVLKASTDPATLQCDICEEVVKIVEQYAEENKTEVCVCVVHVCVCSARVCV